ncbi:MAG TPA: glycosyltransferase family 87 protein [Streptosporangiaceae bacterium]
MTRRDTVALRAVWLATRTTMFVLATTPGLLGYRGDVAIYHRWYDCCFAHGAFPAADSMWQYPPGAAVVFWLPGVLPGSYLRDFAILLLATDLAITVMLARHGRRPAGAFSRGVNTNPPDPPARDTSRRSFTWPERPSRPFTARRPRGSLTLVAAWYWVCGVPLIGPVALTRFDLVPVALSVAALGIAVRPAVRGGLIGAGTAIKIWPLALLAGTPPGQWRRTVIAAAVAAGVVFATLIGGLPSFFGHQDARGVEIESVVAAPIMIWRQAGWHGNVAFHFGSQQLSGPGVGFARDISMAAMALAVALFLAWRVLIRAGRAHWHPEFAVDAPLAATLLFLVTSSVLSPQYLLWVIGLAAVCLAAPRTTQRRVAIILLIAAGLTQVVFPIGWKQLVHGSDLITVVLTVRDLLLVAAAALSCARIFSASRSNAAGSSGSGCD